MNEKYKQTLQLMQLDQSLSTIIYLSFKVLTTLSCVSLQYRGPQLQVGRDLSYLI